MIRGCFVALALGASVVLALVAICMPETHHFYYKLPPGLASNIETGIDENAIALSAPDVDNSNDNVDSISLMKGTSLSQAIHYYGLKWKSF
jgi:hypothetical protein